MPSQYLTIPLPHHPDLVKFQNWLRGRLTGVREWQDPATFHITLVYVPDTLDADLSDLHIPMTRPFAAKALKLHCFDAGGDGVPVVLLVEKHPSLLRLQTSLAKQIKGLGLTLSQYSESAEWKPHITMCYAEQSFGSGMLKQPIAVDVKKVDLSGEGYRTMASFLVGDTHRGAKTLDGEFLNPPQDTKARRDRYGRIFHESDDGEGNKYEYYERTSQSQAHFNREMTKLREALWQLMTEYDDLKEKEAKLDDIILRKRIRLRGGDGRDKVRIVAKEINERAEITGRLQVIPRLEQNLHREMGRLEQEFPSEADYYRAHVRKPMGRSKSITALRMAAADASLTYDALKNHRGDPHVDALLVELSNQRDSYHAQADALELKSAHLKAEVDDALDKARISVLRFHRAAEAMPKADYARVAPYSDTSHAEMRATNAMSWARSAIHDAMQQARRVGGAEYVRQVADVRRRFHHAMMIYKQKGGLHPDFPYGRGFANSQTRSAKSTHLKYGAKERLDGIQSNIANMTANARLLGAKDIERQLHQLRAPLAEVARAEGFNISFSSGYPDYGSSETPQAMWGVLVATLQGVQSMIEGAMREVSDESRRKLSSVNRVIGSVISKATSQTRRAKASADDLLNNAEAQVIASIQKNPQKARNALAQAMAKLTALEQERRQLQASWESMDDKTSKRFRRLPQIIAEQKAQVEWMESMIQRAATP